MKLPLKERRRGEPDLERRKKRSFTDFEADAMDDTEEGYNPGPDFEEDTKNPLVDFPLTDSTELWLIQWPYNQLQADDFHGKDLTLKLHHDGKLGSFESSSGKTFDVVSFAAQEPDATVFIPSSSESKVVGKISRRVCLARYPEPSEYEKPSFISNLSTLRSGGSISGMSHRDTLTSTHSIGQRSIEFLQRSRKKRREDIMPQPEVSTRSAERSSRASGPESQLTNTSLGSKESSGEKLKKKKKTKVEE